MRYIATIILSLAALTVTAQVSDLRGYDVMSDGEIKFSSFKNKKGIAVIFTSNVCPYSVYYEGRITQLINDYGNDVQFLLVNSHNEAKETAEEMKNKLSTWGISVPYIADKDGAMMKALGARKSPEVYLLKPVGATYSVFYKGAIDNNPQVATDVKEQYLKDHLQALLSGRSASVSATRPIGCMIK